MKKALFTLSLILAIGACAQVALAQSALVHIQGDVGTREAYYANFAVVMNRTPVEKALGPLSVHQLDTVIVYESADKPEFGMLRLQFECVNKFHYSMEGTTRPKQPGFDDPVKVRVGEGSWSLRREDLNSDPLPPSEWRSSASPVLLKLHKIACNEDVLRSAIVKAAGKKDEVQLFRQEIAKIGLTADIQLLTAQLPGDYLSFSWSVLWAGVKRPDPSGKWSRRPTRQEQEEYDKKMAEIKRQYDELAGELLPKYEENIKKMDTQFAFQKQSAEIRKGRRMSRNETLMLGVWEGKLEKEVAIAMGAPAVASAGTLRFLSYGNEFDNRVVVGNRQGAVWEEGLYENCNVQFILLADNRGAYRVADVRIWTESNQIGQVRFACSGLMEVPQ